MLRQLTLWQSRLLHNWLTIASLYKKKTISYTCFSYCPDRNKFWNLFSIPTKFNQFYEAVSVVAQKNLTSWRVKNIITLKTSCTFAHPRNCVVTKYKNICAGKKLKPMCIKKKDVNLENMILSFNFYTKCMAPRSWFIVNVFTFMFSWGLQK